MQPIIPMEQIPRKEVVMQPQGIFAAGRASSSPGKRLEGIGSQRKDADTCQRMS